MNFRPVLILRASSDFRIKEGLPRIRVEEIIVECEISFLLTGTTVISQQHALLKNVRVFVLHPLVVISGLRRIWNEGALTLNTCTVYLVLSLLSPSSIIIEVAELVSCLSL
jgi:hypothetical protein